MCIFEGKFPIDASSGQHHLCSFRNAWNGQHNRVVHAGNGIVGETAPMVTLFMESLKDNGFRKMLKSQFKTVILISHLDMLKECIDSEIVIDKKSGFAHIDV